MGEAGPDAIQASNSSEPQDLYMRRHLCADWFVRDEATTPVAQTWPGSIPDCTAPYDLPADTCPPNTAPIDPLWVSRVQADGTYGPWQQITGYTCTVDPLPAAIATAWRAMAITPTAYATQPATGWAIASMGVVPVADAAPQIANVTVLGTPVVLRATPVSFDWSTSDGERLTTATSASYAEGGDPLTFDPGEHRATLTLQTTWEGHYSLDGGSTWTPAPGTATTTSATTSIHVYSPRAFLVDCDASGQCAGGGSADGTAGTLTDPDADGIDNHLIPDDQIAAYLDAREDGRAWTSTARRDA